MAELFEPSSGLWNHPVEPISSSNLPVITIRGALMNMSAGIGQSIRIKGEVTAREPFLIAGHVEGTIDVDGHTLTVAEEATVSATVSADTVVVQGTIKGETSAATKIAVQPTAKLEGAFSAPSISVAEGAIVQGRIETTRRKEQRAVA